MRIKRRRKKLRNSLAIALISAFLVVPTLAYSEWVAKDYVTYYGYTDELFTANWDLISSADSYEWRVYHVERDMYVLSGESATTSFTIQFPRTGHYIIEVRSKNEYGVSEWAKSIDSTKATVNGESRAWWVYGYISAPGPITIE